MAVKEIKLRWPSACSRCESSLPKGAQAWWDSEAKAATCQTCEVVAVDLDADGTIDVVIRGQAGLSAQREYEKRSKREASRKAEAVAADAAWRAQIKADRPILGRIASALRPKPVIGPESQATKAWADGAAGERALGDVLASCPDVYVLNDRCLPGTRRSNIDHVVVAPSGVYVIDAKNYDGQIEMRDKGTLLRVDDRLYVAGRDRTKLVRGMAKQVEAVRAAVNDPAVPVIPVLCFVASEWPFLARKGFKILGVAVVWPARLASVLSQPGDITPEQARSLAAGLADALPPTSD